MHNPGTDGTGNVYTHNDFEERDFFLFWDAGTFDTIAAWESGSSGTVENNIGDDPLFVDAGSADFNLTAGSPAIDAGVDVGLTFDFIRTVVPQGLFPDIGLLEAPATKLVTLNAVLQEQGLTKTVALTAVLVAPGLTETVALSGVLQETGIAKTVALTAVLEIEIITRTKLVTLDASLIVVALEIVTINANLSLLTTKTVALSGSLVGSTTLVVPCTAVLTGEGTLAFKTFWARTRKR